MIQRKFERGWVLLDAAPASMWHIRDENGKLGCCTRTPAVVFQWRQEPKGRNEVCPACRRTEERFQRNLKEAAKIIKQEQTAPRQLVGAPEVLPMNPTKIIPVPTPSPKPQEGPTPMTAKPAAQTELLSIQKFCKKNDMSPSKVTAHIKKYLPNTPRYGTGFLLDKSAQEQLLKLKETELKPMTGEERTKRMHAALGRNTPELMNRLAHIEIMLEKICVELGVTNGSASHGSDITGDESEVTHETKSDVEVQTS